MIRPIVFVACILLMTLLVKPDLAAAKTYAELDIIGYYFGSGGKTDDLEKMVDWGQISQLNYAFALPTNEGKVVLGSPKNDKKHFEQLVQIKQQHPHLKTLISIGGWGNSSQFSNIASDHTLRMIFAESIVDFIKQYQFDGVDIDWEYPVSGGAQGTKHAQDDKQNFTLLLKRIRLELDYLEHETGKPYLLSIAAAPSTGYLQNVEIGKLVHHVDYINLMTYDMNGHWDLLTGENAPLWALSSEAPMKWSTSDTVQSYLEEGVPAEKVIMGIPFYGRQYDMVLPGNNGQHQFFLDGGRALTYDQIIKKEMGTKGYSRYWDKRAQVPFLWNGFSFISYEDPESIRHKAEYVRQKELGGVMIWELSQDHHGVLLHALEKSLHR